MKLLKMILDNPQESRKEWLKMIFAYHAKLNKRAGDMQFWTHEIEHNASKARGGMIVIARFNLAFKKQ